MPRSQTPQPVSANPRLLVNRKEAADILAISERTLWALTAAGELPAIKIRRAVRYAIADLQMYIDAQRVA